MSKTLLIILFLYASSQLFSQYTIVSGGTINACSGNLTLGSYTPGDTYTITICSNSTSDFQISLNNLSLNTDGGTLCAFDGNNTSAPLIGCSFTGTAITTGPGNTSGCLTIQFQTSGSGASFNADIQCNFICEPFQVNLTTVPPFHNENGINYIDICEGESVSFNAFGIYTGNTYSQSDLSTTFLYDFDYSQDTAGLALTNVCHVFDEPKGYVVNVSGIDQYNCNSINVASLRVRVSLPPSFDRISSVPSFVCTGQPVSLSFDSTLVNDITVWNNIPVSECNDTTFLPDGSGVSYISNLFITDFTPGDTLADINDLQSICINIEHSFLGDLTMYITCPNGTTVQLENQGGGGCYLGVPVDIDTQDMGVGWDYCFSPNPQYGVMSIEAANNTTLPSGSYASYQPLANLIGCPLNGQWTITVTDNWSIDNGYIFHWEIGFSPSLYSSYWEYSSSITNFNWSAPGATGTNLISNGVNGDGQVIFLSTGSPDSLVYEPIMLSVSNNFGCNYDTTIFIGVVETIPISLSGLAANYILSNPPSSLICLPPGGVLSGPGIIQPDIFDPLLAGPGTHIINYDYYYLDSTTTAGQHELFADDFSTDKGWTGYGYGGWQRDTATSSSGCSGAQDPDTDHSPGVDDFIIGTYIGECYQTNMIETYWLTSPIINCSNMDDCVLEFWSLSGCESSSFDHLYIDAFDGSNWVNLFANSASTSETSWTLRYYTLAQADSNSLFQVRFGIGTTDGSVTYQGWNIDDLSVKCNGNLTKTDTICVDNYTQIVSVDYSTFKDYSALSNEIKVFPNPANNVLYIETNDQMDFIINITDLSGKTILSDKFSGTAFRFPIDELNEGMYLVKVNASVFPLIVIK